MIKGLLAVTLLSLTALLWEPKLSFAVHGTDTGTITTGWPYAVKTTYYSANFGGSSTTVTSSSALIRDWLLCLVVLTAIYLAGHCAFRLWQSRAKRPGYTT